MPAQFFRFPVATCWFASVTLAYVREVEAIELDAQQQWQQATAPHVKQMIRVDSDPESWPKTHEPQAWQWVPLAPASKVIHE